MTTEPKHTPTPWQAVAANGNWSKDQIKIHPMTDYAPHLFGSEKLICTVSGKGMRRAETQANAAFIVRACNSHDALVAALTRMVEADKAFREKREYPFAEASLQAIEALAAAGVKEDQ